MLRECRGGLWSPRRILGEGTGLWVRQVMIDLCQHPLPHPSAGGVKERPVRRRAKSQHVVRQLLIVRCLLAEDDPPHHPHPVPRVVGPREDVAVRQQTVDFVVDRLDHRIRPAVDRMVGVECGLVEATALRPVLRRGDEDAGGLEMGERGPLLACRGVERFGCLVEDALNVVGREDEHHPPSRHAQSQWPRTILLPQFLEESDCMPISIHSLHQPRLRRTPNDNAALEERDPHPSYDARRVEDGRPGQRPDRAGLFLLAHHRRLLCDPAHTTLETWRGDLQLLTARMERLPRDGSLQILHTQHTLWARRALRSGRRQIEGEHLTRGQT